MQGDLFEYDDYKAYLRDELERRQRIQKGQKSKFAESVGCHGAYLSQVLNGDADLSLEHAERANRYFGHGKDESLYFVFMVQFARAGTKALKGLFASELRRIKENQFELKNRLEFKRTLTEADQVIYYSAWYYAAIHVLVSVPGCNDREGLSQKLGLTIDLVGRVLDFLKSVGLVVQKGHSYEVGTTSIHLESKSPMIAKHHTNWRMRAIHSLDQVRSKDLHYSSVVTVSQADADRVRSILVRAIDDIRRIVKDSKDEEGFCYAIDFFKFSQ